MWEEEQGQRAAEQEDQRRPQDDQQPSLSHEASDYHAPRRLSVGGPFTSS
jgi:hypothetical protein